MSTASAGRVGRHVMMRHTVLLPQRSRGGNGRRQQRESTAERVMALEWGPVAFVGVCGGMSVQHTSASEELWVYRSLGWWMMRRYLVMIGEVSTGLCHGGMAVVR